jgi:filamentous hemagglutinin
VEQGAARQGKGAAPEAVAPNGGKKVSLDLFGGKQSQNPGSILVDKIAEEEVRADATRLPFANAAADELIASNPFIPGGNGIGDWLPEAARVLKRSGRL